MKSYTIIKINNNDREKNCTVIKLRYVNARIRVGRQGRKYNKIDGISSNINWTAISIGLLLDYDFINPRWYCKNGVVECNTNKCAHINIFKNAIELWGKKVTGAVEENCIEKGAHNCIL